MSISSSDRQQILAAANYRCEYCKTSSVGCATVIALRLNNENAVEARAVWVAVNLHPPEDN